MEFLGGRGKTVIVPLDARAQQLVAASSDLPATCVGELGYESPDVKLAQLAADGSALAAKRLGPTAPSSPAGESRFRIYRLWNPLTRWSPWRTARNKCTSARRAGLNPAMRREPACFGAIRRRVKIS